jgi:hypothetical protein
MPTHLLLRSSFQFMDTSAKNQAVITPHFRRSLDIGDPTSGTNAQQLCDDLASQYAFLPGIGTTPYTVTAYNVEGAKPRFPLAQTRRNVGSAVKQPAIPPELSVCLSFYSGDNRPRFRGRLYLPAWLLGGTSGDMGRVVPTGLRDTCQTLVGSFAGLGGANVDWGVWSGVSQAFHKATNWFISDAWAIQRRRGIKEITRSTGTTSG